MRRVSIIAEALREIERGVSARECALRFGLSRSTLYRHRSGPMHGPRRPGSGRPRALTPVQEQVCLRCWQHGEATLYELASIYRVTAQTVRNVLKRQIGSSESKHRERNIERHKHQQHDHARSRDLERV